MHKPRIAIIDYKMCNLFSVEHACIHVGAEPVITSDPNVVDSSDGVILPGVGAFHDAMANLRNLGLDTAVEKAVSAKKPFMGICLGFQLLFASSEEFGSSAGLGIFGGTVKKIPSELNGLKVKIPQMGWNRINKVKESAILSNVDDREFMYFVHSFFVSPEDDDIILTKTEYQGFQYCSSILRENVFACQFHPEKSGFEGIKIYRNWVSSLS